MGILVFIEYENLQLDILRKKYGWPNKDVKKRASFWDNAALLKQRPKIFGGGKDVKETETTWRVFVGHGAAFEKDKLMRIPADFPDGLSNTIMIVEAANAVPWTKPDELLYGPEKPLPKLGGRFKEGFLAGMADGTVRLIPYNTDVKLLRALITRAGGEVIDKVPGREVK